MAARNLLEAKSGENEALLIESLFTSDLKDLNKKQNKYFEMIREYDDSELLIKVLINLCEYLVSVHNDDKSINPAFWVNFTLKTIEAQPQSPIIIQYLNKTLCVFAQLFSQNTKFMMAEGLFRQAIDSLQEQPVSPFLPMNLLKA